VYKKNKLAIQSFFLCSNAFIYFVELQGSLKSSVDYLSHFLITKNVDIQMKESQFEKDAERRNKDKPPTGARAKTPAQKTTK